jgi:hypothetical protein
MSSVAPAGNPFGFGDFDCFSDKFTLRQTNFPDA